MEVQGSGRRVGRKVMVMSEEKTGASRERRAARNAIHLQATVDDEGRELKEQRTSSNEARIRGCVVGG